VFQAAAILLGSTDMKLPSLKKTLFNAGGTGPTLPEKLRAINLDTITLSQFRRLQRLLLQPEFDLDFIQTACKHAVPLAIWCRCIGVCLARTRFHGRSEVAAALVNLTDGRQQSVEDLAAPTSMAVPPHEKMPAQQTNNSRRSSSVSQVLPAHEKASPQEDNHSNGGSPLRITPVLSQLDARELAQVSDLTVSRPDVGTITFHGITDCTHLDVASLIHLDVGEVLVYPAPGTKPQIGEGLNKRATVTMYQCWPPNGRGHLDDVHAQQRYRAKIQQMTEDKKAKFIDYDCNSGIWKFQVEHF